MAIDIAIEWNGSDQRVFPHEARRTEGDLLAIAREIAAVRDTRVSEVTVRFVDAFEELLHHFPSEEIIEEGDPAYPDVAAENGCRTCASGAPCRVRIAADIEDILLEAGLTDAFRLPCLEWMIAEGCSSLTQSTVQMAEGFRSYVAEASPELAALPANLARTVRSALPMTVLE